MSGVTVVKIGGSVLNGLDGYRRAAAWLAERAGAEPLVVVVSAEFGQTDALLAQAASFSETPDADALDLLWSTGELRSVALLTLALRAEGVRAAGLNVHETGLHRRAPGAPVDLNPLSIRAALSRHAIVVVPGFLATSRQRVVTLGRGGSDWSAVVLAAALGASRCELIKDVAGYFTADPRVAGDARPIDHLDFDAAMRMADEGCPLVQRQASEEAARANLPLVVRSFESHGSLVDAAPVAVHHSHITHHQSQLPVCI